MHKYLILGCQSGDQNDRMFVVTCNSVCVVYFHNGNEEMRVFYGD